MPPRLPDETREAILADVRAGEKSRGQIARDHGVSAWTVGNIAKEAFLHGAFSREKTKNACEAAAVDNRARRLAISTTLLDRAEDLLEQMRQPYRVFAFGGKDNEYSEHERDRPPPAELRNLMVSAATAIDKHLALDKHDAEQDGLAAVDAWLRSMTEG